VDLNDVAGSIKGDWLMVPQAPRRAPALSIAKIVAQHKDQNSAIVAAYATSAYSYREIAAYFNIHFLATVGRIVRSSSYNARPCVFPTPQISGNAKRYLHQYS
jgi:hypothetical protein